jgi:hypothetical protein
MTKTEKEHYEKVASLGCIACKLSMNIFTPASIHHLVGLKYRSTGKKSDNDKVIALCHTHHQGSLGIHTLGYKAWERDIGYTQEYLLEFTNEILRNLH